ncbi:thiamine phosphate synthase [bacterium]|nr:MAG: thiamine phosphate synthase [bacterium]
MSVTIYTNLKKRQRLNSPLYAIIDRQACGLKDPEKIAKECVSAGVRILQLRDKTEGIGAFYKNALLIKRITANRALFIINDRADIAKLSGADGLHLGQSDLPIKSARALLGPRAIIGKSCHSLKQALNAEKEGADYVSIGPIFKTPTKPGYRAVGLGLLREARTRLKVPIVAIGGINKDNIALIKKANVKTAAVVRAVCKSKNVTKAVGDLERLFQ